MIKLILATRNSHKVKELIEFLNNLDVGVLTLNDISNELVLQEDGATFEANAIQKARTVFNHTGLLSLADDSGLEVFYLNGRPGVYSARYSGKGATDELNNQKLLLQMRGVAPRRRGAQFRSVLALVGDKVEIITEGICSGVLGESPRGTNGFGYDPIFIPDGHSQTYAELTAEQKNLISHRSRSFAKMKEELKKNFNCPERK